MIWGIFAAACFVLLIICLKQKADNMDALLGIVASIAGLAIAWLGALLS